MGIIPSSKLISKKQDGYLDLVIFLRYIPKFKIYIEYWGYYGKKYKEIVEF